MGDGATSAPSASGRKLSPLEAFTSNFRNKQLHSSFDGIPTEEAVKQNFICSLKGEGLAKQKGRLYLTQNYLAFTSSLFGKTTKHLFKWEDIVSIEADIGEIIVSTPDQELPFSSFINFEEAVEAINECWRGSLAGPSTNGIVFVHHPAGKKPVTDSNTSDSDDDYTSSETSDSEGEVTFEDLLNTVNNAKESIGQEITEEKERQKKKKQKKDSDDDSSSSSSSDEEDDKTKEEEELEKLKKAALEERKALLQKLKKQKEDELEQKKLELAQKLKEKQEHSPPTTPSTQHEDEDKVKDEKTEEVWGEVEKTAEELEAKEEAERREEEERRRRREEQEQQEREAKAREVEEKLRREKEDKERYEREEREREEKKREALKTSPPSTTTPTPSTPTTTLITPTTKPVLVPSSSFLNSWWIVGASVAAAVVVGAVVYKMRSGK